MYRFVIAVLAFCKQAFAQEYLLNPVDATCISSPFGPRTIRNHPEAGTFHFGLAFQCPRLAGTGDRGRHCDEGTAEQSRRS